MGHWDHKNICLQILSRTKLIDSAWEAFIQGWGFSRTELKEFQKEHSVAYNKDAEKIIRFFMEYKDGVLLPDKYNDAEPVNIQFNKDDISEPISWLSYPCGAIFLKKKYKFDVFLENQTNMIVFDGNNKIVNTPKRKPYVYLSSATFWFSKQRKIDMVFLEELLRDLSACMEAEIAIIYDQEDYKILFDLFHPENVGTIYDWNVKDKTL